MAPARRLRRVHMMAGEGGPEETMRTTPLDPRGAGRRRFLGRALCCAAAAGLAPAAAAAERVADRGGRVLRPPVGGSDEPYPVPWLDKNGSHNQSPGPGMDPSSIYHFEGRIARANDFTGQGTDGAGKPLLFGAPSTDFSFMDGECWTPHRRARRGVWAHL